jgi:hypothetical protein
MSSQGIPLFLRRLSTFSRVVTFDKRGQGLSDRITLAPSFEQRMDDVRAVMDVRHRTSSRLRPFGFNFFLEL